MGNVIWKYALPPLGEAKILPFSPDHHLVHFGLDGDGVASVWAIKQPDGFSCMVSCFGTGWDIPLDAGSWSGTIIMPTGMVLHYFRK